MPTETEAIREQYFALLERFMAFCAAQPGGASWMVRLHCLMQAEMGEPVVDPQSTIDKQKLSVTSVVLSSRQRWKDKTFRNLATGQEVVGIKTLLKVVNTTRPTTVRRLKLGLPIRGDVWIIVPPADEQKEATPL